jgi:hypothetical protein
MRSSNSALRVTKTATGGKKVDFVHPLKRKNTSTALYQTVEKPKEEEKLPPPPPQKKAKSAPAKMNGASTTTIAQATALLTKNTVTPSMKKSVLDKQYMWVESTLYDALTIVGNDLEMKDMRSIYYFYNSFLKPQLIAELDRVKHVKTGGSSSIHLSNFIPLHKYISILPDITTLAMDMRSEKHVKFYKMLIFKMMEAANQSLIDSTYMGMLYLPKGFYKAFEEEAMKAVQKLEGEIEEEENGEEEEENNVIEVSPTQEEEFILEPECEEGEEEAG